MLFGTRVYLVSALYLLEPQQTGVSFTMNKVAVGAATSLRCLGSAQGRPWNHCGVAIAPDLRTISKLCVLRLRAVGASEPSAARGPSTRKLSCFHKPT